MRILDRELQRDAQLMRIERTVAGLIVPECALRQEALVADLAPGADARGIAEQIAALVAARVVDGAVAREADGLIGIALARAERVAEPDDQQVLDGHDGLCRLAAVHEHGNRGAERVGNDELDRLATVCRHGRRLDLARMARRQQPHALLALDLEPLDAGNDNMALGIDVVRGVRALIPVALGAPARPPEYGDGPAVAVAGGELALSGQDRGAALRLGQRFERRPVHLGVGRRTEQAERVLHLPGDDGLREGSRHRRAGHARETEQKSEKGPRPLPAGSIEVLTDNHGGHLLLPLVQKATTDRMRSGFPQTLPRAKARPMRQKRRNGTTASAPCAAAASGLETADR